MAQVTKGRRMGLKDVYVALVTTDTSSDYITDTPVLLSRSLSAKVTEKKNTDTLYADDTVDEFVESFDSATIEIDLADLDPEQEALLKGSTFNNGFLVDNEDDVSNTIAIGWRAKRTDKKYEFVWFYVGQFNEGVEDDYETNGEKIKTQSKTLKGSFRARKKDGNWRTRVNEAYLQDSYTDAKTAIKDWFSKVQEPIAQTSSQSTSTSSSTTPTTQQATDTQKAQG